MFTKKRDGMFDTASAALCRDYFFSTRKNKQKTVVYFFFKMVTVTKKKIPLKKRNVAGIIFFAQKKITKKNYSQTVSVKQLTHLAKAQEVKKVHPRRQYYISGFVHWLIDKLNENIL